MANVDPKVVFVRYSENRKTGNIPQAYISGSTCPDACPQKNAGCYARYSYTGILWRKVDREGVSWDTFLERVRELPKNQLWRYGVAGDLPGKGNRLDRRKLAQLVEANAGRRGYAYTHTPATPAAVSAIREANLGGFVINWSCDTLAEADRKAALKAGPVVVTLPSDPALRPSSTPAGRRIVVCPAADEGSETCVSCKLCARASRQSVIGFPAHGTGRLKVEAVFFSDKN